MADTSLKVKLGKDISEPFPTTHGIPQGGALSTLLFAAYMEAPLKLIRRDMFQLFNQPKTTFLIQNMLMIVISLPMIPIFFTPWMSYSHLI